MNVFSNFEFDLSRTLIKMKKIFINTLMILFLPLAGFSQFTHMGLEVGYSSEVKEPGIGLFGIYRVNDEIKLTPNFMYYLPHTVNTANGTDISEGTQRYEWWMINMDGNYVIINQGMFEGYGLMGLNFANMIWERDEVVRGQVEQERRQELNLGLNVGAGIRLNLGNKVVPFGELRYTLGSKYDFLVTEGSTSQFGIFAGILIRIAEDKDRTITEDF